MKNLNEIVQEILKNKSEKLTTKEIVSIIKDNYRDFYDDKMIKNNRDDKGNFRQIRAEIAGHYSQLNKNYNIYRTADKTQKYYYSEEDLDGNFPNCNNSTSKTRRKPEHSLYPLFLDYCQSKGIEAMRLDENHSENKKGLKGKNEWLHPDIIGYVDLFQNYEKQSQIFLADCPCNKFDLYSFEIKDNNVTMADLKEWFFQTVSNSSWANYSYLVAEGVQDDSVMEELELLCRSYKIGFIRFNKAEIEKDIDNAEIIIRAQRTEIDWDMINRLSKLHNSDFDKYLQTLIALNKYHKDQNAASPKSFYE